MGASDYIDDTCERKNNDFLELFKTKKQKRYLNHAKEIREFKCALVNVIYCKLVSKNLPINVKGRKNHATSCNPCGLVVSIAAFHQGDPGSIPVRNIVIC